MLWLPLIALVPWLWARLAGQLEGRDLRVWLPLAWVVLVLLFFSLSSGKRGVYILPAVPAFVLACAPFLPALAQRRGPRNMVFGVACGIVVVTFLGRLVGAVRRRATQDWSDATTSTSSVRSSRSAASAPSCASWRGPPAVLPPMAACCSRAC